ncbi:LPS-assembly protein [Bathymodiolus platifrons methanotrophic gill symbiont]|uniref:LPS-assembly protein LptD n=1 Tax=Bathymodiolus platifrons methanotrophic gill symbiont TaxID=113268 RepID=UPI0011CB54D3|nr:LPS assembly protein LptD [Bathymodiolus platifrons methanotrophic gill symbiont]TXK97747.1 LPS biosynthesis protein [Methylococcaceae bacterium HT1]TXL15785.1 LPS biosynthesis protein [Methylococcaceae bacterium HT3]TXL22303.1 LPS biosynthesis protein [Methylococcaceae bacterium HT2]GFO75720.1 LPS-assembly protein [Bathymodiolus platifrons methanotrophic gill symbiont]
MDAGYFMIFCLAVWALLEFIFSVFFKIYMLLRLLLFFVSISVLIAKTVEANELESKCNASTTEQRCDFSKVEKQLEEQESRFWFKKTFDQQREQVFMRLRTEFDQDPWSACRLRLGTQPIFSVDKQMRAQTPMDIFASSSEMFDAEFISLSGNVDLQRADQHLMANQADYNQASGVLDLYGDITYSDGGMALNSTSALVNMQEDSSLLRNVSFIIPSSPIRGSADVVYRDSPTFSRYKEVTYTACEPGNQDWMLHASKMKVNDETGRVAVKHGWLEFKSVPVLYFPYGSFPIDDRRLTGLLTPTIGLSGRSGVDIGLPFYWNIAPNYDVTLAPRYMTERGFMFGADFRYLWHRTTGKINFEIMPEDKQTETFRWGGSFLKRTQFTDHLSMNINANYVSDSAYFSDLDGSLGLNNRNRYLESNGSIAYNLPWLSMSARIDNYQNIDPGASDQDVPYRRLPQLKLDMFKSFDGLPLDMKLDSEYVYFQRHFPDGRPQGQRFNIKPEISFPFVSQAGFVEPKVAMQHTQYWLDSETTSGAVSLSKTLPIISVDSGLFFERDFESLTHTIEPRLFYLYVPYTDQSDLPNFDTSLYDFTASQLFRDNEFNGVDKTQNANQLTTALTTRLVQDGRDRLKLTVGEIFYFADRKVNLIGNQPRTELFSNLITEFSSEITDELKFISSMQWSFKENEVNRGNADLRYRGLNNNAIFNIGYRFQQRQLEFGRFAQNQVVASAMVPIYDGWSAIGLYRYSILDKKNLEYFIGVEKDSCCWRFRVIYRQFLLSTDSGGFAGAEPQNSIFFQLELKGFTSLGDKVDEFLLDNISGYRKPTY